MLAALPPVGNMRMLPVYEPAANALELTLTVKGLNGVVPVATLVESQRPPLVVLGVTVKVSPAVPEALVTMRFWFAGLDPCNAVKASEAGATVTFPPAALTVSVTPTV